MGSVNKGSTGRNKDNSRETGVVGMGAAMLPRAGMEGPRESFLLPGPYRGSMAGTYWLAEGFLYCQASGTFWKLIHHHDLSLPSRCQEMVLRRVLCSSQGRSGAAPPPRGTMRLVLRRQLQTPSTLFPSGLDGQAGPTLGLRHCHSTGRGLN